MKPANLDYLFQDMIRVFSHLVDTNIQTKEQFCNRITDTYSLSNPKTNLFYQSAMRSEFDTIRLSKDRQSILFNQ